MQRKLWKHEVYTITPQCNALIRTTSHSCVFQSHANRIYTPSRRILPLTFSAMSENSFQAQIPTCVLVRGMIVHRIARVIPTSFDCGKENADWEQWFDLILGWFLCVIDCGDVLIRLGGAAYSLSSIWKWISCYLLAIGIGFWIESLLLSDSNVGFNAVDLHMGSGSLVEGWSFACCSLNLTVECLSSSRSMVFKELNDWQDHRRSFVLFQEQRHGPTPRDSFHFWGC